MMRFENLLDYIKYVERKVDEERKLKYVEKMAVKVAARNLELNRNKTKLYELMRLLWILNLQHLLPTTDEVEEWIREGEII